MISRRQAYLIYDERMELHNDLEKDSFQVERPQRIVSIIEKLATLQSQLLPHQHSAPQEILDNEFKDSQNYSSPFVLLKCEAAKQETIELAHTNEYYNRLRETSSFSDEELKNLHTIDCTIENDSIEDDEDMYFCKDTFLASTLACGGVQVSVDAVTSPMAMIKRALAIVRPPGHHACAQKAMGFCFFNSVVVAAKHALKSQRAKKVAILDWDIHHGNGSQDLTYDDPNILYISIHRYGKTCGEEFFPGTGRPTEVGGSEENMQAVGTNVNIAWTQARMGNSEYAAAMSELVLPLLQKFGADLIIISCGLDAAEGDLIGDCNLLPSMYYKMTGSILRTLGDIPFVVALEGGYNTDVISACMEAVALAVLDEEWDEDGTSSQLNVPFDLESSGNYDEAARLKSGRDMLSKEYDFYASEPHKRGRIKKTAVKDINKTIRCLRRTPVWMDCLELKEIPVQFLETNERTMVTRRVTRSKKASEEKEVENIELSFQYLTL